MAGLIVSSLARCAGHSRVSSRAGRWRTGGSWCGGLFPAVEQVGQSGQGEAVLDGAVGQQLAQARQADALHFLGLVIPGAGLGVGVDARQIDVHRRGQDRRVGLEPAEQAELLLADPVAGFLLQFPPGAGATAFPGIAVAPGYLQLHAGMRSALDPQQQKIVTDLCQHGGTVDRIVLDYPVVAAVLYHAKPGVLIQGLHLISRPMKRRMRWYMPNQFLRVIQLLPLSTILSSI